MVRGFPAVQAEAETADVLQGSVLRLLNTLRRIEPESTRHFFNLAAMHIRRELLDLARRCKRAEIAQKEAPAGGDLQTVEAATDDDLDVWCRFHEAVEQLPVPEREVMALTFYQGLKQVQIAELLRIDERTIRRRWQSACLQLHQLVGEKLPCP
jgi:RNA polymerase sigma-70 factor (ECF subfamily)